MKKNNKHGPITTFMYFLQDIMKLIIKFTVQFLGCLFLDLRLLIMLKKIFQWRIGWDLNPWYANAHNCFRDSHNRPLCHLSEMRLS